MLDTDVLMITHRWPAYTRRTLPRLLETASGVARVWIWHNGDDQATLRAVKEFIDHESVAGFHHSRSNVRLTIPTNWMWAQARGRYVAKVDDDCLVDPRWLEIFRRAHEDAPELGVVGSWRFYDEDLVPALVEQKMTTVSGGHRIMRNPWVQGSGYLLKRSLVEAAGPLRDGQSFTDYCVRLALAGAVNGWYYPFVHEEHFDDPRSPMTGLRTDDDLRERLPLSAQQRGIVTLEAWTAQMRRSAIELQAASPDPRQYVGWRRRLRTVRDRLVRPRVR